MKKSIQMVLGVLMLLTYSLSAQESMQAKLSVIAPDSLAIAYSKTTNLVFPYAISSVDRGSQAILAQKAKRQDNILQVKAAHECFLQTNLTVITSDGTLYSFILNYNENPSELNLNIGGRPHQNSSLSILKTSLNEAEIEGYSKMAAAEKEKLYGVRDHQFDIKFRLNGLFINNDVMYYRIVLKNGSNINYDIDQLRFFIRDQKKAKRTASQEIEIKPLYILNENQTIESNSEETIVYALPKFTIPNKKFLAIQITEINGGRNLELKVKSKKLSAINILPTLP